MIYTEFSGENGRDEFKRELIAEKVINLLTSDINISPMIIDGNWGSGKTEFCNKLINKFKKEHTNYELLYIDAFQADHADSPLMTILSSVISLQPDEEKKKKLIEKAIPILRYSIATLGKGAISHILKTNSEQFDDDFKKLTEEISSTAIDASVRNLLKEHENVKKDLEALQKILAELSKENPIVIFIDELDRCRPDFAVKMIETIKHTFDINGVKFVLVTNTQQLTAAIHHRYGDQVDARRYLDKFIKFAFSLSNYIVGNHYDSINERELASVLHFSKLVSHSNLLQDSFLNNQSYNGYKFAESLIRINKLSLRDTETFVRYLEICNTLSRMLKANVNFGYQLLYILGIFIFSYKPDLAKELSVSNVIVNDILTLLNWTGKPKIGRRYGYPISDIIAVALVKYEGITLDIGDEQDSIFDDYWYKFFEPRMNVPDNPFEPIREIIWCLQLDNFR